MKILQFLGSNDEIRARGDFYNNGTTTATGGAAFWVGQGVTVSFQVSVVSTNYKYCYKTCRLNPFNY